MLRGECQAVLDKQTTLSQQWLAQNLAVREYNILLAKWTALNNVYDQNVAAEELFLRQSRPRTKCEAIPLRCPQYNSSYETLTPAVECGFGGHQEICVLTAAAITTIMTKYKEGDTNALHNGAKCPVPTKFMEKPVPPKIVTIPFAPMQCCIQDFTGMVFGENSHVDLAEITQTCQTKITNMPLDPLDPPDPPDPVDPVDLDAGTQEPFSVGALLAIVLGALVVAAVVYYFLTRHDVPPS
jgi:hypothetical protein